jgi:hypothetical protein
MSKKFECKFLTFSKISTSLLHASILLAYPTLGSYLCPCIVDTL